MATMGGRTAMPQDEQSTARKQHHESTAARSVFPSVQMLEYLQQTAGNQAVSRLLGQQVVAAPAASPVQRTAIQRDDAPAPAAGNPVLHAMFQASVATPIHQAAAPAQT